MVLERCIANRCAIRGRLWHRNTPEATRSAQHISCIQYELYLINSEKTTASVKHYYQEHVNNMIWMLSRMITQSMYFARKV